MEMMLFNRLASTQQSSFFAEAGQEYWDYHINTAKCTSWIPAKYYVCPADPSRGGPFTTVQWTVLSSLVPPLIIRSPCSRYSWFDHQHSRLQGFSFICTLCKLLRGVFSMVLNDFLLCRNLPSCWTKM